MDTNVPIISILRVARQGMIEKAAKKERNGMAKEGKRKHYCTSVTIPLVKSWLANNGQ